MVTKQPTSPAGRTIAIPFVPSIKAGHAEAQQCADQLTMLIAQQDARGFAYRQLESVTTLRNNGCLSGLFGPAATVITVQVAVFERRDVLPGGNL